ncbi:uncharacterized protein SPAPADRAFT_64183 [Spathaspora passalidarum NRRL Y-27907]|uniref:Globin domain-containing protein n=1 Tax=Spathaspora passalidarum (strain NRRL Y-27907 / 11-Y1) TaxID=619300 RepID=G3AFJ3_SPAPN|nr:uncharacterized protein SPAPADRAFT_64183 [Spathaspora passalidarum NRRL Y-27907]EGW34982.1 hypothetical protein SPAPADRAFT_64183 [Spathaspora passalidarum NRRL Y-27907]
MHSGSEGFSYSFSYVIIEHLTVLGACGFKEENSTENFSSLWFQENQHFVLGPILIRYTWNTLLVEDEGTTLKRQTRPSSPDFLCECTEDITPRSSEDSFDSQDTITGMARVIKSNSTGIATSLFCRQFYANIIARDREMKNIFPSIEHQSLDLASVLTIVVLQLDDLSSLEDYLMKLGKRHTRILNIEPVHYEILGEVLIQTFHERFGNKFNQELEIVWIKLYLFLANSLLQYGIDPVLNVEKEAVDLKRVPTHMSTSSVRTEKTLVGSPKKGLYQDEKAENSDIDSVTNEVHMIAYICANKASFCKLAFRYDNLTNRNITMFTAGIVLATESYLVIT